MDGFEVYEVKVWDNVHQEQCEVLVNVFFFFFHVTIKFTLLEV